MGREWGEMLRSFRTDDFRRGRKKKKTVGGKKSGEKRGVLEKKKKKESMPFPGTCLKRAPWVKKKKSQGEGRRGDLGKKKKKPLPMAEKHAEQRR